VQDAALLDTAISDADTEFLPDADEETDAPPQELAPRLRTLDDYRACAERTYQQYQANQRRFHWLPAHFFTPDLKQHLLADAQALLGILHMAGEWDPSADAKLDALYDLLVNQHPADKALVFTQFADTALYLREQLEARGVDALAVAISGGEDPYTLARRFSPRSNNGLPPNQTELRVLIATDVLSEGQNLQDAHIVVNYDLPWAIIRLIQRAGRVDRIGQTSDTILVYSFFPADGVESIIGLRERLVQRLQANREILGTDEVFFDEEVDATGASHFQRLRDLYTEKAGALDDDSADEDIDLSSLALQVWNSASEADQKAARDLPNVVYATRALSPVGAQGGASLHSVITYLRFPDGTDTLVQVDARGNLVSQSLSAVFRTAACAPDTPPLPRAQNHHELVARCAEIIRQEQATLGGQLGALRSLRRKLYERLQHYREQLKKQPNLFAATQLPTLERVIDLLYRYPLKSAAEDALRRQLKLGIDDESLLEMLARMADDDRLCAVTAPTDETPPEPQIVCSMGLVSG
jgi:hypothetical protein